MPLRFVLQRALQAGGGRCPASARLQLPAPPTLRTPLRAAAAAATGEAPLVSDLTALEAQLGTQLSAAAQVRVLSFACSPGLTLTSCRRRSSSQWCWWSAVPVACV